MKEIIIKGTNITLYQWNQLFDDNFTLEKLHLEDFEVKKLKEFEVEDLKEKIPDQSFIQKGIPLLRIRLKYIKTLKLQQLIHHMELLTLQK